METMQNNNQLNFLEQKTVEQFKQMMNCEKIEIRKSKKGNLFYLAGNQVGPISKKGMPNNPIFSRVSINDGQEFWLLHENGMGSTELVACL